MSREEVRKLLGGYATGTLTADEQQALFAAALEDQELFDALAREQGLRDLLRDPGAKAELLAALDERPARGWRAWMRRPLVAGLAMAGLAAVGVAVWQAARKPVEAPVTIARALPAKRPDVAEEQRQAAQVLKDQDVRAEAKPATNAVAVLAKLRRSGAREKTAEVDKIAVSPAAPPAPVPAAATPPALAAGAPSELRDQKTPPPARQSEALAVGAVKQTETITVQPAQQQQNAAAPPPFSSQNMANPSQNFANARTGPALQQLSDARTMFYQQPAMFKSSTALTAETKDAEQARAKKVAGVGGVVGGLVALPHPGVRCSILRGSVEADLTTVLSAGEAVRLNIMPNVDGFLYVLDGQNVVASGVARSLQAFRTSELRRETAGQMQLRVVLTRVATEPGALAKDAALPRANFAESTGDKEAATYIVLNGVAPLPQVALPITLTWR
jgi:hypothetical protein